MTELTFYSTQSMFTDPGAFTSLWDKVEPTIPAMKAAIQPLLFHYRAHGGFSENGIAADRIVEVDLRYADAMLSCIQEASPFEPGADRIPAQRMVGCCRDWALLFVSLARHHGFAARSRVGFANYFADGWWIDHTIAELWDDSEQRWRLIDAELPEGFKPAAGAPFDPLDIPRDRFLPGVDAWASVRSGRHIPEQFVVAPEIEVPMLRGIPYLWHNIVQDLAALNRYEMILWDVWGIDLEEVNEAGAALLDEVAVSATLAEWRRHFTRTEFNVPEEILSFSPYQPESPKRVRLREAI